MTVDRTAEVVVTVMVKVQESMEERRLGSQRSLERRRRVKSQRNVKVEEVKEVRKVQYRTILRKRGEAWRGMSRGRSNRVRQTRDRGCSNSRGTRGDLRGPSKNQWCSLRHPKSIPI